MRFITALCVLFSLVATATATDIYRNEAEFKAILESGWFQDSFDDFTNGSFVDYQLDRGPVNGYSYSLNAYGDVGGGGIGPTMLYSGDGDMSTSNPGDLMVVTFTGNLPNAVGWRLFPEDTYGNPTGGIIEMELNDGTSYTLEFPHEPQDPPIDPFVGFVSDVSITSMIVRVRELESYPFRPKEGDGVWQTLDDLIMGRTATTEIPEPGTLALLGIGAALTSLRKRRTR